MRLSAAPIPPGLGDADHDSTHVHSRHPRVRELLVLRPLRSRARHHDRLRRCLRAKPASRSPAACGAGRAIDAIFSPSAVTVGSLLRRRPGTLASREMIALVRGLRHRRSSSARSLDSRPLGRQWDDCRVGGTVVLGSWYKVYLSVGGGWVGAKGSNPIWELMPSTGRDSASGDGVAPPHEVSLRAQRLSKMYPSFASWIRLLNERYLSFALQPMI